MPKKLPLSDDDKALREHLGASIRWVTAKAGHKTAAIAEIGGVSLAHQYRIEAGERVPDALYLIKVARHLGVSVDELCGLAPEEEHAQSRAPAAQHVQTASGDGVMQVGGSAVGNKVLLNTKRSKIF